MGYSTFEICEPLNAAAIVGEGSMLMVSSLVKKDDKVNITDGEIYSICSTKSAIYYGKNIILC